MDWRSAGRRSRFWGKTDWPDRGSEPIAWHPLEDHCIDVAACAEALLNLGLLRRRLARLAGLDDLDAIQRARLCVLAGLHDIGKFNHGFQEKVVPGSRRRAGHVREALDLLAGNSARSRDACDALQAELLNAWNAGPLLRTAICHHGGPEQARGDAPEIWSREERDPIAGIAALTARVLGAFPLALEPAEPFPESPQLSHGWAGLMVLADWLGSNRAAFPFTEPGDGDRLESARAKAARLLMAVGLDPSGPRAALGAGRPEPGRVLGGQRSLRPAQAAVRELPLPRGPSVTVLEAETGSGKTEAALLRFADLFQAGCVDGLYFALPTRAAAAQIARRVRECAERLFGGQAPRVILAVPGYVNPRDAHPTPDLGPMDTLWDDALGLPAELRAWAEGNTKRYLAGTIVVGTIDQVLLSALKVKHANLRAAALLRHLLVVDELHASDAYMGAVLREVLAHHRAAGGHALLMSATLGCHLRDEVLWPPARRRRPGPLRSYLEAVAVPYPLVSFQDDDGLRLSAPGLDAPGKTLRFELRSADADHVAARALEHARAGARVLVIRSTVKDCLATQVALERLVGSDRALLFQPVVGVPSPHHGRYAPADRLLLDAALEAAFRARTPRVVIATQTVEQSLDLDADRMITDLCPMDVLLQRVGRLHRHRDPTRPAAMREAVCEVLVPDQRDLSGLVRPGGERKGAAFGPLGLGTVYPDLRVLDATWSLLEGRGAVEIPRDNRALVEGATHPELLRALGERSPTWRAHAEAMDGLARAQDVHGKLNTMPWDKGYWETPPLEPEGRIGTRLGDPDRAVALDPPFRSAFGQIITTLSVPVRWWRLDGDKAMDVARAEPEGDRLRVRVGELTFWYSRLGLERDA